MQFVVATLLAFASAAFAQTDGFDAITSPPQGSTLKAGETFKIVWDVAPASTANEKIDILLLAGSSPQTLNVVDPPIAQGVTNSAGGFDWAVPADLGDQSTYGIKIVLESDPKTFQFSFPFAISASEGGSKPKGNSTTTAKPTSTSSGSDSEETESDTETETETSSSRPKTTLYTTVDNSSPTPAPTTKASPGAGVQATAGAFAVLGGLAIAALAM